MFLLYWIACYLLLYVIITAKSDIFIIQLHFSNDQFFKHLIKRRFSLDNAPDASKVYIELYQRYYSYHLGGIWYFFLFI